MAVLPVRLLLVISSEPDGPVVRQRWRAFAPALEDAGVVLQVAGWPKDGLEVANRLGRQAVVVLRELTPPGVRETEDLGRAAPASTPHSFVLFLEAATSSPTTPASR